MGCKGICDRLKNDRLKGAYCSVCMRWLPFSDYGFKCICCSQRLRLRNRGAQRQLFYKQIENAETGLVQIFNTESFAK